MTSQLITIGLGIFGVLSIINFVVSRRMYKVPTPPIHVDIGDAATATFYPDTEEWYYYSKAHMKGFSIQSDVLLTESEIHKMAYDTKLMTND
jgi:hypothetical protein